MLCFSQVLDSATANYPSAYLVRKQITREKPGKNNKNWILQICHERSGQNIESSCVIQDTVGHNTFGVGRGCGGGRLLRKVRAGATVRAFQRASWGCPRFKQNSVLPSALRKAARSPCDLSDEYSGGGRAESQGWATWKSHWHRHKVDWLTRSGHRLLKHWLPFSMKYVRERALRWPQVFLRFSPDTINTRVTRQKKRLS